MENTPKRHAFGKSHARGLRDITNTPRVHDSQRASLEMNADLGVDARTSELSIPVHVSADGFVTPRPLTQCVRRFSFTSGSVQTKRKLVSLVHTYRAINGRYTPVKKDQSRSRTKPYKRQFDSVLRYGVLSISKKIDYVAEKSLTELRRWIKECKVNVPAKTRCTLYDATLACLEYYQLHNYRAAKRMLADRRAQEPSISDMLGVSTRDRDDKNTVASAAEKLCQEFLSVWGVDHMLFNRRDGTALPSLKGYTRKVYMNIIKENKRVLNYSQCD